MKALRNLIRHTSVTALVIIISAIALCATAESLNNEAVRVGIYYGTSALSDAELTAENGFRVNVSDCEYNDTVIDVAKLSLSVTDNTLHVYTPLGGEIAASQSKNKISISSPSGVISINGKNYRGYFEFYADDNGKIVSINVLSVEDYLKGVLPCEVYTSWNIEALKAAAVVTRTYTLRTMQSSPHSSAGFDLCATTHCQMYSGMSKESESTDKAVDDTSSLVVAYNGKLAMTPYSSSSGGYTESAASAWGSDESEYPYLITVKTPYEDYRTVPNGKWENIVFPADIINYIPTVYRQRINGDIIDIDYSRKDSGYISNMTVTDTSGGTISLGTSGSVRSFFGTLVKSANFGIADTYIPSDAITPAISVISSKCQYDSTGLTGYTYITSSGTYKCTGVQNVYVFDGQGYGHGVGMSQFGARCMADAGFKYDEIIQAYFPGTTIINTSDILN